MSVKKETQKKGSNAPAVKEPGPDFFERLGKKTPWVLLGTLSVICFFVFKDFLLQEKYYLFKGIASDSINGLYPYYYCVADYMTRYGIPGWSFNMGMGHSLFPFLLQDPANLFLYMAGKDHIMAGTVYKEVAKVIAAGMIFYYYLRLLKLSDFTAIIGSLLYAFCGFMIVGSFWYMFSFEALNFALLLLAFELLFLKRKWYLFPLPIFLMGISQPVNLYIYGVFMVLYALLRLIQTGTLTLKSAASLLGSMALLTAVGVLVSGPFFLENTYQILRSPRGTGANSMAHELMSKSVFATPSKFQLGTCLLRLFSDDMNGTGQYWEGWWNYLEVPELYVGLPCLLLMPQLFPYLQKKVRAAFIVFISIWFIGIFFPYVRNAFWLFAGDYYRAYSFFGAFCFLWFSLLALDNIIRYRKINVPILLVTLAVLFIILVYPFYPPKEELLFPDKLELTRPLFILVGAGLLVYAGWLYMVSRQGSIVNLKYAFMVLIIIEVTYMSHLTVNNMEEIEVTELNKNYGYDDHQQDAVNFIKAHDHSFYRIDKACSSTPARPFSYNDGMVQGYKGTCVYSSFNQLHYINYLQLMEVIGPQEYESRWAVGVVRRPLLECENSVKYVLTKNFFLPFWRMAYDSIGKFGDVTVLKNRFVLPLGYTYDTFIRESTFRGLNSAQKDLVSLRAGVVNDEDVPSLNSLKEFHLNDTTAPAIFSLENYRGYVNARSADTLRPEGSDDNHVRGTIDAHKSEILYLSVPFDKGWTAKVDGRPVKKYVLSDGMTGLLLAGGRHRVEMAFEPPFLKIGLWLSVAGILAYATILLYRQKKKTRID